MNNELIAIQKECRRRQKELAHTIDVSSRGAAAIDNIRWCNLHKPEVTLHYKSKREEYRRLYMLWFGAMTDNLTEREIDDQIREARLYKFGQYAFLLVETIAAAVLAAIYFYAPRVIAVIIGVVIALLLGAAASAVVTRWVRHEAAGQPTKQLVRITRGLLVLGLPWLAACVTALAVLRSQGAVVGASLFFVTTAMVTLLSPLSSGLCGYAADLLLWSKRLCADMSWIRALERELDHLAVTSERSISPPIPPDAIGLPIAAILAIAASLFGAPAVSRAADLPVYLYADVSGSSRAEEVAHVLRDFSSRLSKYEGTDTLVVTVIPFFQQAFAAAPIVTVSIPGVRSVACPAVGNELTRLSRSYAEAAQRDAEQQCVGLRAEARKDGIQRRSAALAKLNEAIDRLSGLKLSGHCTAVNAIIRRAISESPKGISVVVSDLENSCATQGLPANLRRENQLFLIPVSSREHPIEAGFDGIQTRFARTMPWAQVIEPFRLDAIIGSINHPKTRVATDH